MVNVRELLVPVGVRRKGKVLDFQGVTVHNVDNESTRANADANARYQASTPDYKTAKGGTASWHYTVDEKEIVRSIPEDEVAYHCGNNEGNNTTVSVEICDNADGDILKATDNAAELTADILKRHGHTKAVWGENLFQHHDWANKNCPSKIRAGKPYGWEAFVAKVNEFMGAELTPVPTPGEPTTYDWEAGRNMYRGCHVELQNYMNFRTGPGENHPVIRKLYNGTKLALLENCGGDWLNVYNLETGEQGYVSDQWIVFDSMMKGEDVRGLQKAINKHTGLGISEDATLGDKTAAGIVELQRKLGLNMDGQAGRKTVTAAGGKWTGK